MKIFRTGLTLSLLLVSFSLRAQTPVLNLNPVLLDFGVVEVGSSETQVMTLSNLTAAPLPITGFSASGDAAFSIDVNGGSDPCGGQNPTLDSQGSCTMAVTYAPTFPESSAGSVSFTPNGQASLSVNARFLGEAPEPDTGGGCALGSATGLSGAWLFMLPLLPLVFRRIRG